MPFASSFSNHFASVLSALFGFYIYNVIYLYIFCSVGCMLVAYINN